MKRILRYICIGLGFIFLWYSASGFIWPLIMPATFRNNPHELFAAGVLFLPIGFIFRFISLSGRPTKEKVIQIIRDYFMLTILTSLSGLASIVGIVIVSISIIGYIVSDNILRKVRKSYEDSNLY